MLVRFLTSIADVKGWAFDFGEVADVPDARAAEFIANGVAEPVVTKCPHCGGELATPGGGETTTAGAGGERATLPRPTKRGGA